MGIKINNIHLWFTVFCGARLVHWTLQLTSKRPNKRIIWTALVINTFKNNVFAPMWRFQLFSTVLPSNSILFLSCRPFVVITFSTCFVGVEVPSISWLGELTVNCPSQEIEETSTPTRPVENLITTKGLQDRNNLLLDGRTVENKGELIRTALVMFIK